ncbi:UNVERIFIED_CONTAM: hypothetical protein GTU68_005732 [Idotea baltica]|nr:hypothetical protein [Idotea baltica]
MADIVDKNTRSRMMSRIKGKNTKPELAIRSGLHRLGLRFCIHNKRLPGKPDIVFPKYRVVVFVHGCFWHRHNCEFFQWPKSNRKFWQDKINGNVARDDLAVGLPYYVWWRGAAVSECVPRGKNMNQVSKIITTLYGWIAGEGKPKPTGEFPS